MGGKSQKRIIRGAFLRLMIINVFILVATCACGLIDNIFVGIMLGENALAAMGFFSPVTVAVGLSYVIILGTQVLTGNLVGARQTKKVNQLFVSAFITLTVLFAVFSICCFVFNEGLARLLGADEESFDLLCDYIKGYAPGIVPQTLAAMLMALCSFNNDINRSYVGIGAMIVGNTVSDALLIEPLGLFGIGLASSISSLAAFLVLFHGFFKKDKLFHFQFSDGLNFGLVLQAALRGLPSMMLSFGVIIKNYCFNYALVHYTGAAGVAVAEIMATVNSLAAAIPSGCNNAFSSLAGIYFGEEDRESLLDLSHTALQIGVALSAATMGLIMALSTPLSKLFVPNEGYFQDLACRMFIISFTFLVPNFCYNMFLQAYRAQNRMLLVNIMSFAETTVIGLLVLVTVKPFGTDAAWLANTIVDILCVIVVMVSVVVYNKKLSFTMSSMLKLPPGFGASEGEYLTFSATNMNDVVMASKKAYDYCLKHHSPKLAYHVGLCVEEMAGNVIKHGFNKKRKCYADIRIVSKDGEITLRIRDNCKEFDPRKRINMYDPDHPEKNIGLRISAKAARQIDYYNNAGINTLIMKF